MIPGDECGLNSLTFVLQKRKIPEKPQLGYGSNREWNPGPLDEKQLRYLPTIAVDSEERLISGLMFIGLLCLILMLTTSCLNIETFSEHTIITRTIVRVIIFQNAQWQKPIFQELISRVLFEIETRGQVICIALGPVTICIAIRTIGLLYLFYSKG